MTHNQSAWIIHFLTQLDITKGPSVYNILVTFYHFCTNRDTIHNITFSGPALWYTDVSKTNRMHTFLYNLFQTELHSTCFEQITSSSERLYKQLTVFYCVSCEQSSHWHDTVHVHTSCEQSGHWHDTVHVQPSCEQSSHWHDTVHVHKSCEQSSHWHNTVHVHKSCEQSSHWHNTVHVQLSTLTNLSFNTVPTKIQPFVQPCD
jgi:hypothetical protein